MYTIQQAANILDTSEYEVLRLAYIDWHGSLPSVATINAAFSRHFRDGDPPHWARHYARKVVAEFEQQHLGKPTLIGKLLIPRRRSARRHEDAKIWA